MTDHTEGLPPLPAHPEPRTYCWTPMELHVIEQYGEACAKAARAEVIEAAIDLVAFHGGSVEIEAAIRALSSKEAEHG